MIRDIVIGNRVRKDMGDIRGLADSMERHGLLHPIVVMGDGTLVAGQRRIEAARLLGCTEISATVVDVADLLAAEQDENTVRKDWTRSEAVVIGRLIEEQERPRIREQRIEKITATAKVREALKRGEQVSANHTPSAHRTGVREIAAHAVGMSPSQYHIAKQVVSAAEADPEKFGDLPALMDETGNVSGTYRELEHRRNGTNGRHAIHRKRHQPKADAMVQRAVSSIEGICAALGEINPRDVTAKSAGAWGRSLEESSAVLRKFARGLKR